jgi:hypothetical protein
VPKRRSEEFFFVQPRGTIPAKQLRRVEECFVKRIGKSGDLIGWRQSASV